MLLLSSSSLSTTFDSLESMQSDSLLTKLVQTNQNAGKTNEAISLLVASVSSSLDETSSLSNNYFKRLNLKCSQGDALLKAFIQKLTGDVISYESKINASRKSVSTKKVEIENYTSTLQKAKEDLHLIEKNIKNTLVEYRNSVEDAEKKLIIIRELTDILTDQILKSSSHTSSFIDKSSFNTKYETLKELLRNSSDSLYSPVLSTLVQVALDRNFADRATLKKILSSLQKLAKEIRKFKNQQDVIKQQRLNTLKNEGKDKLQQLKAIGQLLAEANSNRMEAESAITSYTADVAYFKREIVRKNNEYDFWKKLCRHEDDIGAKNNKAHKQFKESIDDVSKKLLDLH